MIERYLSVQDVIALVGILGIIVFILVKIKQRKEGWGWKKLPNK